MRVVARNEFVVGVGDGGGYASTRWYRVGLLFGDESWMMAG